MPMNVNSPGWTWQYSKSCCIRVGPRCDTITATINSLTGHTISWAKEMRYLGVNFVQSRTMKCSLDVAKRVLSRHQWHFWKIGRTASEEVVLELIRTKCIPILLYGLEVLPLYQYQLRSLDFVINRPLHEIV